MNYNLPVSVYLKEFIVHVYEDTEGYKKIKGFRSGSFDEVKEWIDREVGSENGYEVFQRINC